MVSIILPNYNHYTYLPKRLDSILNQTYQDFEVILLDDASTDDSIFLLEKYKNHPKVSHFIKNKENSGSPFIQWHKGLLLAKGEITWIAESDDVCDLDFLEKLIPLLSKNDVAVSKTIIWYHQMGKMKEIKHPVFNNSNIQILNNDSILKCPALNVSSLIFKTPNKEQLNNPKFFEYNIIGDRVFYFEFFQHKSWIFEASTKSYFRKTNEGLSNLDNKDAKYLKNYFYEHLDFIIYASTKEFLKEEIVYSYKKRFFNRIKNRLSIKDKLTFGFLKIFIKTHIL